MSDVELIQCPDCGWRISADTDGWEDALHEHREAHQRKDEAMGKVCKIDGCDQPAAATSGMYALLCVDHAAERKQQKAQANGHLMLQDLGRAVDDARQALETAVERLRRELG